MAEILVWSLCARRPPLLAAVFLLPPGTTSAAAGPCISPVFYRAGGKFKPRRGHQLFADLSGEPALIQEDLFFRRRRPAEHLVPVREAAEPADDAGMHLGPFQRVGVARGAV